MRKKYKNPPINELVIGVYFREPIITLRAEHIGLYWAKIKDEYPNSAQNFMLGNVELQVPNEIFPLPRFWFSSKDEVYLIQVQRNAFLLNWRKREGAYPHYEELKTRFDRNYVAFLEFLNGEFQVKEPIIERCELNYINLIEDKPYFKSFADVRNVIPSFAPLAIGTSDSGPAEFNVGYVYSENTNLSLAIGLQSRRNITTLKDTLYFELRATGALSRGTRSEADALLAHAHDVIGDAFNALTSSDVQRQYWQPKED